jgi:hypothetical protein
MAGDVRPPALPDGGQVLIYRDGATQLATATVRSFRIVQREGTRDAKKLDATVAANLRELGEAELDVGATIRNFRIVRREGTGDVTRWVAAERART